MDMLVTGNIRSEEALFLQLMDDLHPLFMDCYLHKTDSDFVLACETKGIVKQSLTCWVCQFKVVRNLDSMDADGNHGNIISAKNNSN